MRKKIDSNYFGVKLFVESMGLEPLLSFTNPTTLKNTVWRWTNTSQSTFYGQWWEAKEFILHNTQFTNTSLCCVSIIDEINSNTK